MVAGANAAKVTRSEIGGDARTALSLEPPKRGWSPRQLDPLRRRWFIGRGANRRDSSVLRFHQALDCVGQLLDVRLDRRREEIEPLVLLKKNFEIRWLRGTPTASAEG